MSLALGIMISPVAGTGGGGPNPVNILGSSLLGWWTADRADLITVSGSAVTSWKDVKNGYDAVQAVSAARPLYSATSFNGAPGVTFDGSDDELTLASQPFPSGANPCEIWTIVQQDALPADTGNRCAFSFGGNDNLSQIRSWRTVSAAANKAAAQVGTGATVFGAFPTTNFSSRHLTRVRVTATLVAVSADNDSEVTANGVPATGTVRARIGAVANTAAGNFWNGKIRDIIVTSPLSADQITALNAWALPRRML